MSRFYAILSLTALVAGCLVQATNYNDLISPELEAFEAAIKHATETVVPPKIKLNEGPALVKLMQAAEYTQLAKQFVQTNDLAKRVFMLTIQTLAPLKALVVEDVLKNVRAGLQSESDEETRVVLRARCQDLQRGARSILQEFGKVVVDQEKLIDYYENTDKDTLRVVTLASFCTFL